MYAIRSYYDVKFACCDSRYDVVIEHQIFAVGVGNNHPLLAAETTCFADCVKAFYLLIDAAYGLV